MIHWSGCFSRHFLSSHMYPKGVCFATLVPVMLGEVVFFFCLLGGGHKWRGRRLRTHPLNHRYRLLEQLHHADHLRRRRSRLLTAPVWEHGIESIGAVGLQGFECNA